VGLSLYDGCGHAIAKREREEEGGTVGYWRSELPKFGEDWQHTLFVVRVVPAARTQSTQEERAKKEL